MHTSPGRAMHHNISKLLRTAASRVDMSQVINTTSDFVENMVVQRCGREVSQNIYECEVRVDPKPCPRVDCLPSLGRARRT